MVEPVFWILVMNYSQEVVALTIPRGSEEKVVSSDNNEFH